MLCSCDTQSQGYFIREESDCALVGLCAQIGSCRWPPSAAETSLANDFLVSSASSNHWLTYDHLQNMMAQGPAFSQLLNGDGRAITLDVRCTFARLVADFRRFPLLVPDRTGT